MTSNNLSTTHPPYVTTELEIASFLVALGFEVLDYQLQGKIMAFVFEPEVTAKVSEYFSGASLPVLEVFKAHRHLRTMIKQLKMNNGTISNGGSNGYYQRYAH